MHWSTKYAINTCCGSDTELGLIGETWLPILKEFSIQLKRQSEKREKFLTKGRYVKVSKNSSTGINK